MWRENPDNEAPLRPPEPPDALTQAAGTTWYATRWTLKECRQSRPDSTTSGYPQRFDRYYPTAAGGGLFVDILAGDRGERGAQERSKHVAFKRAWCKEHDWRYLAIGEDDAADASRARDLISALDRERESEPASAAPDADANLTAPRPRRGGVQRPKAVA